ncbi:MAG: YnbE family lipoprotein [Oleibacter sp.]|nr:YnbE family lipoprotein [Thalassolituus sp.]
MKRLILASTALIALSACTLKVAAPEKPITINLNVKIEHEVRIKVEKDLEQLFEKEDGLF